MDDIEGRKDGGAVSMRGEILEEHYEGWREMVSPILTVGHPGGNAH